MTVDELIEKLAEHEGNAQVYVEYEGSSIEVYAATDFGGNGDVLLHWDY